MTRQKESKYDLRRNCLKTGSWSKWAIPLYLLSAQQCSLEGTLGKPQEKGGTIVLVSCQFERHLIVPEYPFFTSVWFSMCHISRWSS